MHCKEMDLKVFLFYEHKHLNQFSFLCGLPTYAQINILSIFRRLQAKKDSDDNSCV